MGSFKVHSSMSLDNYIHSCNYLHSHALERFYNFLILALIFYQCMSPTLSHFPSEPDARQVSFPFSHYSLVLPILELHMI